MRAALLIIALACAAGADAGPLYKWTDAEGKVHFGDVPPPGAIGTTKLAVQSKPTDPALIENLEVQKDLREKQSAMEDEVRANQEKRAAEELADKRAQCEAAQKRHANLANSRKFATTGADGKETWMSGADADKMKAELKAAADKACEGL